MTEPLRIALMIGALERGGAERQLLSLARGFRDMGHEVELWCFTGSSPQDNAIMAEGISLRVNTASGFRAKRHFVRSAIAAFQPDVLHCCMKRASVLGILSRGRAAKPIVIGTDYSTAAYGKRDHVLWISLMTYRLCDRVITETNHNRNHLVRLAPWLRGRVDVVRNGVDLGNIAQAQTVTRSPFRFIAVGSVYGLKNPVRVVQAALRLVKKGHPFRLDWYGRRGFGSDREHSPEYRECGDLIKAAGLSDTVNFHGERQDIESLYAEADALVHVAVQEGMPNSVVEAMAAGLPLVVSDVSDMPDIVGAARNGIVVDAFNVETIADGMKRMMQIPQLEREAMATRSREIAAKWFPVSKFLDRHIEIYRQAIDRRGGTEK